MYTLLSGLYRAWTQKDEYFVLILGLDNAGKTTFLESAKIQFSPESQAETVRINKAKKKRMSDSQPPNESGKSNIVNTSKITATVGLNIGKVDVANSRLNFWDLGGQTELQALWDKYYSEAHAVIFTVDSNDRERIQESKKSFDAMISNSNLTGVPLLVLANKQDIPECLGVREVKPIFQDNDDKIGNREIMVMGTSGLTGDGVIEGIEWLLQCIERNLVNRPPKNDES